MLGWLKRKKETATEPENVVFSPTPVVPLTGLAPAYLAEVERLEAHLSKSLAEVEALARLKLVEWKIRQAEERKAYLERGVTFPKSGFEKQQDEFFHAFERRLRQEEEQAQKRVLEIERNEVRAIEYQNQDKERREREALADQRSHELELQRIEAQKAVALTISRALREDLG